MLDRLLFVVVLVTVTTALQSAEFHVAPHGSDTATGSREAPFRTLVRATQDVSPGDRILLLDGRYAVPVVLSGIHGSKDAPVTIGAAPGANVVLDGTDELVGIWKRVTPDSPEGKLIQAAQWKRVGNHQVNAMRLERDIYALVYDGRLMTDARWPNARWDDPWRLDRYMVLRKAGPGSRPGEIHDGLPTENTLEESQRWIHYDRSQLTHREETLADTGLDFTGSTALLSCFWTSFGTRITEHNAGQDHFRFDTAFTGSGSLQKEAIRYVINRVAWDDPGKFTRSSHGSIHFSLMGLPALDIPEEWYYHQASRTLYFISPDGKQPEAGKARGKRRDYAITIENSSHVHLKGLTFVGTAALLQNCTNSRIEDCNFRFSAYNKFAVGNYDMPVTTEIRNGRDGRRKSRQFGNSLINCRFEYLDGNAFKGSSTGLSVDNVLIHQTQMTTLGNDSRSASFDEPLLVRRVTISDVGASVGIKGGGIDSVYELNNIMRFGGLQYDGASLQMGGTEQKIYRWNWSHDHPKFSYRFDTAHGGPESTHGEMSFNVAWNTPGGYMVKGDEHLVQNNLLLGEDAFVYLFNLPEWASINDNSLAANNAVPDFFADRAKGKVQMLATLRNNVTGSVGQHLRDPANLDFRPKKDGPLVDAGARVQPEAVPWKTTPITKSLEVIGTSPDIGAYEYGASSYWIPGFKFPHASTPIPPDKTRTARPDCDLMWLGGYKANRHDLYFGNTSEEVAKATKESPAFQRTFHGKSNVLDPGDLEPGQTYFWRVDAMRDGENGKGNNLAIHGRTSMNMLKTLILIAILAIPASAQKENPDGSLPKPGSPEMPIVYTGPKYAPKHSSSQIQMSHTAWAQRHDVRLRHAIGASQFQVLRSNRSHPVELDSQGNTYSQGHTYNHAPNIAYFAGRYWVHYLSGEKNEHDTPGRTMIASSPDGMDWSAPPRTLFPDLKYRTGDRDTWVFMHQRMGFFNAANGRFLGLGWYTKGPGSPNTNGDGIGRVVREIRKNGSLGQIYFLRRNKRFPFDRYDIPIQLYTESPDHDFIVACDELLANRAVRDQMGEEEVWARYGIDEPSDGFFTIYGHSPYLNKSAKALCYFTRKDGVMVALCKEGLCGLSFDNWQTVSPLVKVTRSFDTTSGKSWAQCTSDGRYALVLHPQKRTRTGQKRYPLAVTTSDDGISFSGLATIAGELPPRRYQGKHKEIGPQYVRGIVEHNIESCGGKPPCDDMWLTWSMSKEDIWAGNTPVPIRAVETRRIDESFDSMAPGFRVTDWNTYSPLWAPVRVTGNPKGSGNCLKLEDRDPADYAKAFRVFPEITGGNSIQFDILVESDAKRVFDVDIQSTTGVRAIQLRFQGADQTIQANDDAETRTIGRYAMGSWISLRVDLDMTTRKYTVTLNGARAASELSMTASKMSPDATPSDLDAYSSVERLVFRTGPYRMHRYVGDGKTYPDRHEGVDMVNVDKPIAPVVIYIDNVNVNLRQ